MKTGSAKVIQQLNNHTLTDNIIESSSSSTDQTSTDEEEESSTSDGIVMEADAVRDSIKVTSDTSIKYANNNKTPSFHPLHLVRVSRDRVFTPRVREDNGMDFISLTDVAETSETGITFHNTVVKRTQSNPQKQRKKSRYF